MINKKLLSEVLGIKVKDIYGLGKNVNISKNDLAYSQKGNGELLSINIFELANKCKEWADKRGYKLESGLKYCNFYKWACDEPKNLIDCTLADSEPEAIFKACEWVFNYKGLRNANS